MPDYHRRPMNHAQFCAAVERFQELWPRGVKNSGWRGDEHNERVGGGPESKHLAGTPLKPIACDIDYNPDPDREQEYQMNHDARVLGMWGLYHKGHMHLQGLPVGPVPDGWEP